MDELFLKHEVCMVFGIDDLLVAGAIAGAGSIGGAAVGASANADATDKANQANKELAAQNQAFQERMANTAHQREMADLKAAGLNPILAANGGASSPTGSVATMQAPQVGGIIAEGMRGAGSTALSMVQARSQLANLDADTGAKVAETANKVQQAKLIQENIKGQRLTNARESILSQDALTQSGHKTEAMRLSNAREQAVLPATQEQSRISAENASWDKRIEQIGDFMDNATSALNIRNLFKASKRGDRNQKMREERHIYKQGRMGTSLD